MSQAIRKESVLKTSKDVDRPSAGNHSRCRFRITKTMSGRKRAFCNPLPILWLLHFFLHLLLKCSLSLREGSIMSYIGLRTLPSAGSHGPEGTYGILPGPAEGQSLSSVCTNGKAISFQWILQNPWLHRWLLLKSLVTK